MSQKKQKSVIKSQNLSMLSLPKESSAKIQGLQNSAPKRNERSNRSNVKEKKESQSLKKDERIMIPKMINDEINLKKPSRIKSGSQNALPSRDIINQKDTLTRKTEKFAPLLTIQGSPADRSDISISLATPSKNDSLEQELKEDQSITDNDDDSQQIESKKLAEKQTPNLFKMVNGSIIRIETVEEAASSNELKEPDSPHQKIKKDIGFKINIQQTGDVSSNSKLSEENNGNQIREKKEEQTEKSIQDTNGNVLPSRLAEQEQADYQKPKESLKFIWEAEPIFELSHKYADGTGSPAWKKKQMRHQRILLKQNKEVSSEASMSLTDEEKYNSDELPGDKKSEKGKSPEKKPKKNCAIQEKLQRFGEKIKIQTEKGINIENFSHLFAYKIYEGYRPQNLAQCRDYLEFLINGDVYNEEDTPQNIKEYLRQEIDTVLPDFVNQKHILRFDQNFECGNLDSAYIHTCEEYNLLMKVDSNTKGNTYWFYFSVQDFRIGVTYTFNIYNFTRSMEKFYREGMNVCVKSQKLSPVTTDEEIKLSCPDSPALSPSVSDRSEQSPKFPQQQSRPNEEWRYGACQNINFEASEIPRNSNAQSKDIRYQQFYQKLSFSYTFRQEDLGTAVHFSYALPYSYSDLVFDLREAKKTLMQVSKPSTPLVDYNPSNPTYKVLVQKDYLDAAKYKHFTQWQNDDSIPLISPMTSELEGIQSTGGQSAGYPRKVRPLNSKNLVNKKGGFLDESVSTPGLQNPDNKKISQFTQQHEQIKRVGQANMYSKTSKLENQFIKDENEGHGKMRDLFQKNDQNEADQNNQHSFEITNDYLHYRQEVVAQSMGGLNVYQLTITKRREAGSIRHKKKHVIYIQARLHAAETHGSLIMSKIIKEFSENYKKYDLILTNNIIKLVPMVNPDGVVLGNSRSSLAGVDLNRRWGNPNATIHPELYFLKVNMKATQEQSAGITIFCDLHGHNKNQNCFIYGCNKAPNEGLLSWTKTRLLPKIIAAVEPIFDFNMCKFSQEKTKYNTARVVIWNEFKVTNAFTLETSMHGMQKQSFNQYSKYTRKGDILQLIRDDFNRIGVNVLMAFDKFLQIEAQLEKEFKNTGGWLKKKKLDEITGVTARQKMENVELFEKQKRLQMGDSQTDKLKKSINFRHQSFMGSQILSLGSKPAQNKMNSSRNVFSLNNNQGLTKFHPPLTLQQKKTSNRFVQSFDMSQESGEEEKQGAQSSRSTTQGISKKKHESKKNDKNDKKSKNEIMQSFDKTYLAEYFSKTEMESAIKDSQKPIEKQSLAKNKKPKKQEIIYESDSEPSCDNFGQDEMEDIFNEALSEADYQELFPEALDSQPPQIIIEPPQEELKVVPEESAIKEEQEQVEIDSDSANDQVTSIEEYKIIREQLKEAKAESRQLTEKFEKLSRQINKKIKNDTRTRPTPQQSNDLVIQTPMPFRGQWHDIQANVTTAAHARYISTQHQTDQIGDNSPRSKDILSAGPKSGETQSINRMRNLSYQIEQIQQSNRQPGTQLPAIQQNDINRRPQGGMATSAARANKYKTRNSILNISQFNMENGMTQTTKQLLSQPNQHTNPEYTQKFNTRVNRQPVRGILTGGQSMHMNQMPHQSQQNSNSPNISYPKDIKLYNTSSKKKQYLAMGSKHQTMNLVQDNQPIANDLTPHSQPSMNSQITNLQRRGRYDSHFNQAIKSESFNRKDIQDQTLNHQSFFTGSSISPQKQESQNSMIQNQQMLFEQQVHNQQMKSAINQGKIKAKMQDLNISPNSHFQQNTSQEWVPTMQQNERYLNPDLVMDHSYEISGQFELGQNIRSPVARIRCSNSKKSKLIVDLESRQSLQSKIDQNNEANDQNRPQYNQQQRANVSNTPKIVIKPSQIRRRGNDKTDKPQTSNYNQRNDQDGIRDYQQQIQSPTNKIPSQDINGTQSAELDEQKMKYFGTATGKYVQRQELVHNGIKTQFEQAYNQINVGDDQINTSNYGSGQTDYFNQVEFKKKINEKTYNSVTTSNNKKKLIENSKIQFSSPNHHQGYFHGANRGSEGPDYIPRNVQQYENSPQINQRFVTNLQKMQQSMLNYENQENNSSFFIQPNMIIGRQGVSQSMNQSNAITPKRQDKQFIKQFINNENNRLNTEEVQQTHINGQTPSFLEQNSLVNQGQKWRISTKEKRSNPI